MSTYAIIENGFVLNIVVWDGTGDIFSGSTTMELSDSIAVKIGDAVVNGMIYSKPDDGFEYSFNSTSLAWELTAAGQSAKTAADLATAVSNKTSLLASAQSTISLWQSELLLGTISDTDKTSLTAWITYIKAVQAIDTTKLPVSWPTAPAVS